MGEFVLLVIIIGVIWVVAASANARTKKLTEAKAAYQESLSRLKQKPTDADIKQQTLALGRAYSNLTRDQKGVTIFDEVALSNDINAASAGASQGAGHAPKAASAEERLSKLTALRDKGLVTDEEYQTQRRKILNDL